MARIEVTALLAAIRECVTVVGPGEILAVRLRDGMPADALDEVRRQAERIREEAGVRILFVPGEEFARLRAGDAP